MIKEFIHAKYNQRCWTIYYNEFGLIHKLNNAAIEWDNGGKYWYKNGKSHRLDGPAIEKGNFFNSFKRTKWFINDIIFIKEDFNSWILRIKIIYNKSSKQ